MHLLYSKGGDDMSELGYFLITLVCIIIWIASCGAIYTIIGLRKENKQYQSELKRLKIAAKRVKKYDVSDVEYSRELLEFIQYTIGRVVVIKFTMFKDSHELFKVTKQSMKNLITSVASDVKTFIDFEHIDFSRSLYTEEFLEYYIVHTSIIMTNDLLDKEIKKQIYESYGNEKGE